MPGTCTRTSKNIVLNKGPWGAGGGGGREREPEGGQKEPGGRSRGARVAALTMVMLAADGGISMQMYGQSGDATASSERASATITSGVPEEPFELAAIPLDLHLLFLHDRDPIPPVNFRSILHKLCHNYIQHGRWHEDSEREEHPAIHPLRVRQCDHDLMPVSTTR